MIGKMISHYKILGKLGEGGMGVVYKAKDATLKRFVTLKFLHSPDLEDKAKKARLIQEAQAAAAVNHPNICTVHEIGEADGQVFIDMEYVEGRNLKEKIQSGPLKINEALDISLQIAQGLQAIHDKGMVHRDIKSENIRITAKGHVKIMDFGLAKTSGIRDKISPEDFTSGTVAYMSPEQIRGEVPDCRSDIWSWGVVLYEMLAGRLPFDTEKEGLAGIYSILDEEPEPLTNARKDVPKALEYIFRRAMAKDPANRYPRAAEIMVELNRLMAESDSRTRPAKPRKNRKIFGKSLKWMTSSILFAVAAAALLWFFFNPTWKWVAGLGLPKDRRVEWEKSIAVLPFSDLGDVARLCETQKTS
jgi:serine/threonine protein kinase